MQPDSRPNILLILCDQLRADWLGCAGQVPVRTPNIDALAATGVRFERAYCTSPVCAPSRASLAGGVRPHRLGVMTNENDYPLDRLTYYRLLRDTGYRVAACGKTDLHKGTKWNGPDGWTSRLGRLGFTEAVDSAGKWNAVKHSFPVPHDPYTQLLSERGWLQALRDDGQRRRELKPRIPVWPSVLPADLHIDEYVGQTARRLLDNLPRQAPWYLQVNFASPHEPLDPPAERLNRWQEVDFAPPVVPLDLMSPEDHLAARRAYAALIEGLDDWVGRLVEHLERLGELDRTLVVLSSDHGDMLGDHGRWGKKCYYEPALRVPLIVSGGAVSRPGRVSDALVELPDLAATFLQAAGQPVPADWDAQALQPVLLDATGEHREVVISLLPGHRCILNQRFKLVIRDGQIPVLFDREADPAETRNVADQHPEVVTRLAERLGEEEGRVFG